jgi:putative redox protein
MVVVERGEDGILEAQTRDVRLRVGRKADDGFQSVELLLAALGSCMLGTMLAFAENVGVSLDGVRLELTPTTVVDGRERVSRIDMRLCIDGDVEPQRLASLRRVAEHCKVHSTLEQGPELALTLQS